MKKLKLENGGCFFEECEKCFSYIPSPQVFNRLCPKCKNRSEKSRDKFSEEKLKTPKQFIELWEKQ